jgi:diaminopimelate decarboxylase
MQMSDWGSLAQRAISVVGTPCYIMSESIFRNSLAELNALQTSVRLRHWVSLKTQPVPRLVRAAIDLGLGIEVVSEYELAAVLSAGIPTSRILVNGTGKHFWLPERSLANLVVHFDSISEVRALAATAKELDWRVGLRCAVPDLDSHGDSPPQWDQFGMTEPELLLASEVLQEVGVQVSGLHFNLHTNVNRVKKYRDALNLVARIAKEQAIEPAYVDIGGGLPIAGEKDLNGASAASTFDHTEFRVWLGSVQSLLPSVNEIWMENGRYLSGPAGALVVTVLDKKQRGDVTYLICDGGRVNHARMASFEIHNILLTPARTRPLQNTVVCGPTCSTVDRLGTWMLPDSIEPGDRLIWLTAGAYHIPLETRFSTGLAPVVWFDMNNEVEVIRRRESPTEWWSQWMPVAGAPNS